MHSQRCLLTDRMLKQQQGEVRSKARSAAVSHQCGAAQCSVVHTQLNFAAEGRPGQQQRDDAFTGCHALTGRSSWWSRAQVVKYPKSWLAGSRPCRHSNRLVSLHPATSGTPGSHLQACRTVQIARAAYSRPLAPLVCSLHSRRLGIVGHPGNGQGRPVAQFCTSDSAWNGPMYCTQACCLDEQGLLAARMPV